MDGEYVMDLRRSHDLGLQCNYYCMQTQGILSGGEPEYFFQLRCFALQAAIGTNWALQLDVRPTYGRIYSSTRFRQVYVKRVTSWRHLSLNMRYGEDCIFVKVPVIPCTDVNSCHHQPLCYKLQVAQEHPVSGNKRCSIQQSPSIRAQFIQMESLFFQVAIEAFYDYNVSPQR